MFHIKVFRPMNGFYDFGGFGGYHHRVLKILAAKTEFF